MNEIMDWRAVKRRLTPLGRGAQARLARRLRMDTAYFTRKLKSGSEPTVTQAREIDAFFEAEATGAAPPVEERATFRGSRRVPVYGYAAASGGDRIAFNPGDILDYIELSPSPPGDVFIVRASGSSMEPRVFDGEMLVVQRNVPPARGKDTVIEFTDGTAVVKTYRGSRDGRIYAQQYNDEKTLDWAAAEVKAMHNVWCRL